MQRTDYPDFNNGAASAVAAQGETRNYSFIPTGDERRVVVDMAVDVLRMKKTRMNCGKSV